jgi:hypothetical protein
MLASYVQPPKQFLVDLPADILSISSESDHYYGTCVHCQLAYIVVWCVELMFIVQVDVGRQRACSGFIYLCKKRNVACYNQMIVAIVDMLTSFNFFPRSIQSVIFFSTFLLLRC